MPYQRTKLNNQIVVSNLNKSLIQKIVNDHIFFIFKFIIAIKNITHAISSHTIIYTQKLSSDFMLSPMSHAFF